MREYGKVHTTFWSSETVRSMSEDARTLAFYLLTCPHGTIAGVFRLPDGYVSEDLGWSSERVAEGFTELFEKGFANRCGTTKWVWICKHFDWNPPENPNQRKSAAKVASQVPEKCVWNQEFMRVCGEFLGLQSKPVCNPSETLTQPFLNQEQEQEQEEKKETRKRSTTKAAPLARPEDVNPQVWADWLKLRETKKAAATQTVLEAARREAASAGMSLEDFFRVWCARGSQGLQADWLTPKERRGSSAPPADGPLAGAL